MSTEAHRPRARGRRLTLPTQVLLLLVGLLAAISVAVGVATSPFGTSWSGAWMPSCCRPGIERPAPWASEAADLMGRRHVPVAAINLTRYARSVVRDPAP